jgi:hypothetical protein
MRYGASHKPSVIIARRVRKGTTGARGTGPIGAVIGSGCPFSAIVVNRDTT